MKIRFKKISIQNFYSYGSKQEVSFDNFKSTVVLIDGVDKDTEGSKIGSGKSSFFAAITFALFGETVSNVKVNEIVNYIKGSKALVVLDFLLDNQKFRIERGRKPNILNLYKLIDVDEDGENWENISKADIKDTDKLIQQLIRINFETFLQISLFSVASENNKPFLNLTPSHQKKVLENIFNFDVFNLMIHDIKDDIRDKQILYAEMEASIKEVQFANDQILTQIERLSNQAKEFDQKKTKKMKKIADQIEYYSSVDIVEEKEKYIFLDEIKEHKSKISLEIADIKTDIKDIESKIKKYERELEIYNDKFEREIKKNKSLKDNICPTCAQPWKDDFAINESDRKIEEFKNQIDEYERLIDKYVDIFKDLKKTLKDKKEILFEIREAIETVETLIDRKELDNIEIIMSNLRKEYEDIANQSNHFIDEIEANKKLIRNISTEDIDDLKEFIDGIKAFIKLSEDPKMRGKFLRKFIKQTNEILRQFKKLIPDYNIHIQFNPDFTIRIMRLGKEVSSGSLSNGEKRIGNIMIMMALMKVFKLKNNVEFDAIFMDEVLDSGINGTLLESVYTFIKNVAKNEGMRVFLISHREEIKEKVKETIMVTKSRGISTISISV